jgi:hypothetical protein
VRGSLPGQEQERGPSQGDQHDAAGAAARRGSQELAVLPGPAGSRSAARELFAGEGRAALAAAVRVFGGVRWLRRDAVPEAPESALRRPRGDRQRHRLLLDLWRQPAHDAVDGQPRRPRPRLGQFAVRRQRGVRAGHAARARQAGRVRARARDAARSGARGGGRRAPVGSAGERRGSAGAARARRPPQDHAPDDRHPRGARAVERGRYARRAQRVDRRGTR